MGNRESTVVKKKLNDFVANDVLGQGVISCYLQGPQSMDGAVSHRRGEEHGSAPHEKVHHISEL